MAYSMPFCNLEIFYIPLFDYYSGFLMLTLRPNATIERIRSIINGAAYPPVDIKRLVLIFATKEANIRLKFVTL